MEQGGVGIDSPGGVVDGESVGIDGLGGTVDGARGEVRVVVIKYMYIYSHISYKREKN